MQHRRIALKSLALSFQAEPDIAGTNRDHPGTLKTKVILGDARQTYRTK
jgi:hypothetical protein